MLVFLLRNSFRKLTKKVNECTGSFVREFVIKNCDS